MSATALDLTPVLERLEQGGHLVRGELRPGGTTREWCDPEVLRRLRRASLAALRAEIEPADQRAFARFQASWQGVDRHPPTRRGGRSAARDPRAAAGAGAAAGGVGARRAAAPHRRLLARVDGPAVRERARSCGSARARWAGAPGRVALYFRDDAPLIGPPPNSAEAPSEPVHLAIRERLQAGPCFFTDLLTDVGGYTTEELQNGALGPRVGGRGDQRRVRAAALPEAHGHARVVAARAGRSRRSFSARRRGGQPAVQGRWSLTASLFGRDDDPVARRRTQAELLLERYGIVTREQVLAEGIPGGFSSLYDSLAALETIGVARRGYFVEGLGGAQFALPGAVERLRAQKDDDAAPPIVLAATDPAQPYGAALKWPDTPRRPRAQAGAYVVLGGRRARAVRRARRQGPAGAGRRRRPAHRAVARRAGGIGPARADQAARAGEDRRRVDHRVRLRGAAPRPRVPRRAAQAHADDVTGSRSSRSISTRGALG